MTRARNFNAGPAALPLPALEQARDELLDFHGTGMSVMEQSHRGKAYDEVHLEAEALVRELLGVPDDFAVMFLQGGASQQFATVPMNLLGQGKTVDYVVNGVWGEKALAEARTSAKLLGGTATEAVTTAIKGPDGKPTYIRVPRQDELRLTSGASYVHFTSNETIHGVQFGSTEPEAAPLLDFGKTPVVCDMSSDFMWKPIDVAPYSMIYAGAQKNLGPSGVVLAIVRKDFLAAMRTDLPSMLSYRTHAEAKSLYNTPPTFAIYLVRNVLAWMKGQGGLAAMETTNKEKARRLYDCLAAHPDFYKCPVERGSRSRMNVVFRLPDEATEKRVLAAAKEARIAGLAGHRSVGGLRVSLYNAVSLEWVDALVALLNEQAKA
jgi:phosphoserine aminotransferase